MKIFNYMEEVVKEKLDEIMDERNDLCKCQKCRLDIMVWALNRVPPKYVITEKGRMYTKLREQETQFKADVVRELVKAVQQVSKNPQH